MISGYLNLEHVSKSFQTPRGQFVAVHDVSLEVTHGQIVSLIGHSGCGKSTVLSMIAGLTTPSEGTISLDGVEIKGPGPDRGVVFQNYSLLPWMSVWDNVYEAVDSAASGLDKAEKRERVEHFLRMVKLWDHRHKRPNQISGGMKQRVAVARAFSVHP